MSYISGCPYIGYIYIYDHWLLLLHWFFYHYVIMFSLFLLVLVTIVVYFVRDKSYDSCFFGLFVFVVVVVFLSSPFDWWVFLQPFVLSLCCPCLWDGSVYRVPMCFDFLIPFTCLCLWLGHLIHLNSGLILIFVSLILSFNAGWLFFPLVDINTLLCRYSLSFGKFLGWLILVVPFCV